MQAHSYLEMINLFCGFEVREPYLYRQICSMLVVV